MAHSYLFKAGAYRGLWNALALGQAEDGITLEWSSMFQPIVGDNMAQTVQDLVYAGVEVFVSGVFVEAAALGQMVAAQPPAWPGDGTLGTVGTVGVLANATLAQPLVLTKISGSAAMWSTITAPKAILATRAPVSQLLGNHVHRIPLRFQLLPDGLLDAESLFVAAV